jgi:hypothetical protein
MTEQHSSPPFRIRPWERPPARGMVADHLDIAFRHDASTSTLRQVSEILRIEAELTDRLLYGRKPDSSAQLPDSYSGVPQDLIEGMRAAQARMEAQYGREELYSPTASQFDWGFLSGKVSSIRWVLGDEWDNLDS